MEWTRLALVAAAGLVLGGAAAAAGSKPVPALRPPVARAPAEDACTALRVPQLPDRLPYGPGEALSYEVSLNGAPAARVDIKLQEHTTESGKRVYPAVVNAQATQVISIWARMRAELVTFLDPDRTLPVLMRSATTSEAFTYTEDIRFDQEHHGLQLATTFRGKPWTGKMAAESDVVDALSALYYARSRDFRVGQPFCMDLYLSRVLWRVRGRITGVDTVDTDAGPMPAYAAAAVASILGRTGPQAQTKQVTAWMTADEDRVPVKLVSPTPMGEVLAKLVRFEQGRRLARAAH